jgi:mycothiol synthase
MKKFVDDIVAADGVSPFNEATMLAPEKREAFRVERGDRLVGLALGHKLDDGRFEVEVAVHPSFRRQGIGSQLVRDLQEHQPLVFWAHGNTPGAKALARRFELHPKRELYFLELPLYREIEHAMLPDELTLTTFSPETDVDAWVELNSRVFADHPEQGDVSRGDVEKRMEQPWFDAERFFVVKDPSGKLIGYNWLKDSEIYVIGVDPEYGGQGIGQALMNAGLSFLKSQDYNTAELYVDDSNIAALELYRKLGFEESFVDVQYQ